MSGTERINLLNLEKKRLFELIGIELSPEKNNAKYRPKVTLYRSPNFSGPARSPKQKAGKRQGRKAGRQKGRQGIASQSKSIRLAGWLSASLFVTIHLLTSSCHDGRKLHSDAKASLLTSKKA